MVSISESPGRPRWPQRTPRTATAAAACRALLPALVVLISACTPESAPLPAEETFDLVAEFSSASVHQPTRVIEFGRPEARRHLVRGWSLSYRPIGDGDRKGTWSTGDSAEIEFFVSRPADLEVSLRCSVIVRHARPPFVLELSVNGATWTSLEIAPSLTEHRLRLPAELLRAGQNRLLIEHPGASDRQPPINKDVRVLWDVLELTAKSRPEPASPFARQDIGTVFVPFDTRIDYFVELPSAATLVAERARARGGSSGRLQILWQAEDGPEQVLSEDFISLPGLRLPLPEERKQGRVSLVAYAPAAGSEGEAAGVVLSHPRIHLVAAAETLPGRPPGERAATTAVRRTEGERPNIIVYMIDTLRADHLGCYGYGLDTSPNIDRFALDGILFERAQAQSAWTKAAVASVFTGLWPQVHGANDDPDLLPSQAVTVAELLRDVDYHTAAITSNGNAHQYFGFAQGFDYFKYLDKAGPDLQPATSTDVHEAVVGWMDLHAGEQPFFLFVHTVDPHLPYDPPEPYRSRLASLVEDVSIGTIDAIQELFARVERAPRERIEKLVALYDAEIAFNDHSFGRLVEELKRRRLYRDSLVVLLSDHGEEFLDHGSLTHGKTLYAEILDVPLIVKLPGNQGAGRRLRQIAQHVDLLPTLMDLLGEEVPGGIQGRSLLPLLLAEGAPAGWPDVAVSHLELRGRTATSLLGGRFKLIVRQGREHLDAFPELYDREQDRQEQSNLAPERSVLAKLMANRLQRLDAALVAGLGSEQIGEQELEEIAGQLRALGYLQ